MQDALALITQAVRDVQEKFIYYFWSGLESYANEELEWQSVLKASAWYRVAYEQPFDVDNPPYLSFAWLAIKPMCQLKKLTIHTESEKGNSESVLFLNADNHARLSSFSGLQQTIIPKSSAC